MPLRRLLSAGMRICHSVSDNSMQSELYYPRKCVSSFLGPRPRCLSSRRRKTSRTVVTSSWQPCKIHRTTVREWENERDWTFSVPCEWILQLDRSFKRDDRIFPRAAKFSSLSFFFGNSLFQPTTFDPNLILTLRGPFAKLANENGRFDGKLDAPLYFTDCLFRDSADICYE